MLLDDAIAYGQSQSCSLPHLLGGKKGLEEPGHVLRFDAVTGIGEFYSNRIAVGIQIGPDHEDAVTVHGFGGVDDDVGEDLLEL